MPVLQCIGDVLLAIGKTEPRIVPALTKFIAAPGASSKGRQCIMLFVLGELGEHAAPAVSALAAQLGDEDNPDLVRMAAATALPTPATHAILAQLKAGETVYQAGELPKTLRVSKILYYTSVLGSFGFDFPAFNGKW